MIKHDNLRWIFSAGLGRWAEAIISAKKQGAQIDISLYAGSMSTALRHCLNEWLNQHATKVSMKFS